MFIISYELEWRRWRVLRVSAHTLQKYGDHLNNLTSLCRYFYIKNQGFLKVYRKVNYDNLEDIYPLSDKTDLVFKNTKYLSIDDLVAIVL